MTVNFLEKEVSVISRFNKFIGSATFKDVANTIKSGDYRSLPNFNESLFKLSDQIEEIRSISAAEFPEKVSELKSSILAFTNHGTFINGRKAENLDQFSGVVQIDLDKLNADEIQKARDFTRKDFSVLMGFLSPGGRGYKLLIATTAKESTHLDMAFTAACNLVKKELNLPIDTSTRDLPRLCFFSYDPDIYVNEKCLPLYVSGVDEPQVKKTQTRKNREYGVLINNEANIVESLNLAKFRLHKLFTECEKKTPNIEGSRNTLITQFAGKCNYEGVSLDDCIKIAKSRTTLSSYEVQKCVQGIYTRHKAQHGNSLKSNVVSSKGNSIPDYVYENLPPILRTITEDEKGVDRDLVLIACLTSMSACFPSVYFVDGKGKKYYLNLNSLVIRQSASNKSKATVGRILVDRIQHAFRVGKLSLGLTQKDEESMSKSFLIPGNNSYAGIIDNLVENSGIGLIFETEADVIGDNFSKEWGDYSTLIRCAAEHETITKARKTDKYFVTIPEPKLSIFLTGTKDQLAKIIPSSDNGQYSRFLYYINTERDEFKNPLRKPKKDSKTLFQRARECSNEFFELVKGYSGKKVEFVVSESQLTTIDNFYSSLEKRYLEEFGSEHGSSRFSFSRRSVTNLMRIGCILSLLRGINSSCKTIAISNVDFNVAFELIRMFIDNSEKVIDIVDRRKSYSSSGIESILEKMDIEFTRSDFVETAKQLGVCQPRQADTYLKKMTTAGTLLKPSSGNYQKVL